MRFYKWIIICVLTVVAACAAAEATAPPTIEAVEITTPPKLDGVLDDPCWQGLQEHTGFADMTTRKSVDLQMITRICYDKECLYVAFHALNPKPETIRAKQKKRNGSFSADDYVGLCIDSAHTHRGYSNFSVNAIGTQSDQLELSSSTKTEWRGDWQAAAKVVDDGYNVEMAIPFSVLKYDDSQDCMGIAFARQLPDGKLWTVWPDLNGTGDLRCYSHWQGLKLPKAKPKMQMMGYMLSDSGGDGPSHLYKGLDIKRLFAGDMLGLVSIKPDFGTIEQEVQSVDFSYTERWLPDFRPFFQEWNVSTPSELFYSRRIPEFDAGTRFVGQKGPHQFGVMNTRTFGDRSDSLLRYVRTIGDKSSVGFGLADHRMSGEDNTVAYYSGNVGWNKGPRHHGVGARLYSSSPGGAMSSIGYDTDEGASAVNGGVRYSRTDADFTSRLGLTPVLDQKGWSSYLYNPTTYRGRRLKTTEYGFDAWDYDHLSGSPFNRGISMQFSMDDVYGRGFRVGHEWSTWEQFSRSILFLNTYWNIHEYDRSGYAGVSMGTHEGGTYSQLSFGQKFRIGEKLALDGRIQREKIGLPSPNAGTRNQLISTINYDLTSEKSVGGRLVSQLGKRNMYLVYRQQVRKGTDVYVLYGDPNAEESTGRVSVKLVQPLF